jgi:hypothetical protein
LGKKTRQTERKKKKKNQSRTTTTKKTKKMKMNYKRNKNRVPSLYRRFPVVVVVLVSQVPVDFTERLAPRRRAMRIHFRLTFFLCPFKVYPLWTKNVYLKRRRERIINNDGRKEETNRPRRNIRRRDASFVFLSVYVWFFSSQTV